ncbi:MAG TPA: hypothetical protein VJK54_10710, partial [Chthoniobacterales bacterium]|nr:hypothetical protein [Chthoniobacterales bacterium]
MSSSNLISYLSDLIKKFITSFLLAVSINSSLLLAQVQNKQEETGIFRKDSNINPQLMMHSSTPLTFRGAVKALFSCFAKPSIWPEEVDVISATAWLGGASEGNEDAFAAPHCHSQKNAPEYVRSDTSSPTIKEVKGLFSDDIGREGSETGGTAQGKEVVKAEKRREVDAIFAQARKSKSESGWKEAAVAAIALSSYWNGVVENIKKGRNTLSLSEEEATFQKAYWIEKAGVAKVKWLALRPFGNEWKARKDQADMIMTMAMNHVWPTVSKAMK